MPHYNQIPNLYQRALTRAARLQIRTIAQPSLVDSARRAEGSTSIAARVKSNKGEGKRSHFFETLMFIVPNQQNIYSSSFYHASCCFIFWSIFGGSEIVDYKLRLPLSILSRRVRNPILALMFCLGLPFVQFCSSQTAQVSTHKDKLPSRKVAALLDQIAHIRVEYKSDILLELLADKRVFITLSEQRVLMEAIFAEARNSGKAMPVVDARRNPLDLAYLDEVNLRASKMDTLDIQSRIVTYAAHKQPRFASQLFHSIELKLPLPAACDELSVVDPASYYRAAQSVIAGSQLSSSQLGNSPVVALVQLVQSAKSPTELPSLLDLVSKTTLSAPDLALVSNKIGEAFDQLRATDREIAVIEEQWHLLDKVALLASQMKDQNVSYDSFLTAYRGFLIRSLHGSSCDDHAIDRNHIKQSFNSLAFRMNPGNNRGLELLHGEELSPTSHMPGLPVPPVPSLKAIIPQLRRIMDVKQANTQREYRLGQPGSIQPEISDMEALVDFISSSTLSQSSCSVCNYESKETLIIMLLGSLPQGDALKQTIDVAFNDLINSNSLEDDDPSEWVKLVSNLLNISRTPDQEAKATIAKAIAKGSMPVLLPSLEASEIHKCFQESRDPVISAYWLAETLLSPSFNTN